MSYCRFSTDDYECDLYVYDDTNGGITIHVARVRRVLKEPLPPKIKMTPDNISKWMERNSQVIKILEEADLVKIGLDFDGQSFYGLERDQAADLIEALINLGYRAPTWLVQAVRQDTDND